MKCLLDKIGYAEITKHIIHYERLMNNQLGVFESTKKICGIDDFEVKLEWNDYLNCFNAQSEAIDVKQNKYKITCNIYTPIMLEEILRGKGVDRNYYVQIVSTILSFILYHELFHIVFGHCTLSEYEIEKIPVEVKRKFENMCDMKAVDSMLPELDLFACEIEGNTLISAYASLLASLFIYFKLLEEGEIEKMSEILKDNEKLEEEKKLVYKSVTSPMRDHPFVTFRFDNMCLVIEMHLKKMDISDQVISEIYDESIKYINDFGFKECLKINPYYRKNRKSHMKDLDINYDEMRAYVHRDYLL